MTDLLSQHWHLDMNDGDEDVDCASDDIQAKLVACLVSNGVGYCLFRLCYYWVLVFDYLNLL